MPIVKDDAEKAKADYEQVLKLKPNDEDAKKRLKAIEGAAPADDE